jgi:beta-galactosidase
VNGRLNRFFTFFPHWNWKQGQLVDVWADYNNADEVELYLNGKSLGAKKKSKEILHVMWRIPFHPGTLKAVSRKHGNTVLTKEIRTAGKASAIVLTSDKRRVNLKEKELAFITARIVDAVGTIVPNADNLISFRVTGMLLLQE